MTSQQLQQAISLCHQQGKRAAVHFCSHVPTEILTAAGFGVLRVTCLEDVEDISARVLPNNLCPMVKACYSICQDPVLGDADLLVTESTCDGKKKMYELVDGQEKLWYYQVAQGQDRDYVEPLIRSEIHYLRDMLEHRFGAPVTDEAIRQAAVLANAERRSIMELMAIQKATPPGAWGAEIYEACRSAQSLPDNEARTAANNAARQALLAKPSPVPAAAARILITGCPMAGVYEKIIAAVEENGGVVVCFENCELVKSGIRHVDVTNPDIIGALADCYRSTACAIMAPNDLRFRLLEDLCREYGVEGIIDITLPTCHAYTVERDKMSRFCKAKALPYLALEPSFTNADLGQIKTRVTAFLERL